MVLRPMVFHMKKMKVNLFRGDFGLPFLYEIIVLL